MQDQLGMTTHHPRWAIAYKFKARQGTSKLRAVEFQVGRTRRCNTRCQDRSGIGWGCNRFVISVHNEEYIKKRIYQLGDTVLIERSGCHSAGGKIFS